MSDRYLEHDRLPPEDIIAVVNHDIFNAVVENISIVQQHTHEQAGGRIYVGAAGAALMIFRIAELGLTDFSASESSRLYQRADRYLAAAISLGRLTPSSSSLSPSKCSFLETDAGVASLVLYRALQGSRSDIPLLAFDIPHLETRWRDCVTILHQVVRHGGDGSQGIASITHLRDDGDCEVLYGRAGLLYALLFLRSSISSEPATEASSQVVSAIQNLTSDINLQQLVNAIVLRGQTGSSLYTTTFPNETAPAFMWSWHGKRYLGAAHGVAGILHTLLLCPRRIIQPHIPSILHTVEWLVDLQDSNGNWPSSVPLRHNRPNELVHWCHGAPGMIILLSTVLRRLRSSFADDTTNESQNLTTALREKIDAAIKRGASLVYTRGFLRKGVGLCHGVAGSVFALLAAADARPKRAQRYVEWAVHLALLATNYRSLTKHGHMNTPDRPWSLYEGLAGMCCAWGEIVKRVDDRSSRASEVARGCGMPGFDDIWLED